MAYTKLKRPAPSNSAQHFYDSLSSMGVHFSIDAAGEVTITGNTGISPLLVQETAERAEGIKAILRELEE